MAHSFRLFIDDLDQTHAVLSDDQYHYLKHVRRVKTDDIGELITALESVEVRVLSIDSNQMNFECLRRTSKNEDNESHIILFQSLPKQDKFTEILRSCTELGLHSVVPIVSQRSIPKLVKDSKFARWKTVLESAAEQSKRLLIPKLSQCFHIDQIKDAMLDIPNDALLLMAWEEADPVTESLKHVLSLHQQLPKQIVIFIGPEGGIDQSEANRLSELGFKTVSLGKTVLRVEHAAFSMISNILYHYS